MKRASASSPTEGGIQAAARNLVAAALAKGSSDNCTAVVADYHSPP